MTKKPKAPKPKRVRGVQFSMWLTPEEHAEWKKAAQDAGMPMSSWLRLVAIKAIKNGVRL